MSLLPDESQLASLIAALAEALATRGYAVVDAALPQALALALRSEALQLQESQLLPAGTGRNKNHQLDKQVRTDAICWLEPATEASKAYLAVMEAIRTGLNGKLYLGLFEYECHYARYAPGAFYKTHLDAFGGKRNRILSTIYYLNQEWSAENCGELVLYASDAKERIALLSPTFNRLVVFMSERFPHEVLPTRQERYSLTGWFRVNTHGS